MIEQGQWIGCKKKEAPIIRKKIFLQEPKTGRIEVTGLGYFELWWNGTLVSGERLIPACSQYGKRDLSKLAYPIYDTIATRIYYLSYDLTPYLQKGENELELWLGNGWYRQKERNAEGPLAYGDELMACFAGCVEDEQGNGTYFASDGTETCRDSRILYSNLFTGEIQDYSGEWEGRSQEEPVQLMETPEAELTRQDCPGDRIIRTWTPRLVGQKDGKRIYDAGENISGLVAARLCGREKEQVTLRFAENLDEQGNLDFLSAGGDYQCSSGCPQIQKDVFICGGSAVWAVPKFVWHGFRYFEAEGPADQFRVLEIHSDVPVTSDFDSSSEGMNWLYEAYIRTQLSNMHGGVPSDCPHRERLGYTGDGQITCQAAMMLLDSEKFYKKWIQDILDCQSKETGHIQHTAPFMGGGGGPGGWGCAVVVVPWQYYLRYGDKSILEKCFPAMKFWADYMRGKSENCLVVREEDKGWCLGDWASIGKMELPEPFVNTCFFIQSLDIMEKIRVYLGEEKGEWDYSEYAQKARRAIKDAYYDPETGDYCKNIQGSNAYAWWIGLREDERTLKNQIDYLEEKEGFDTGFLGTDVLFEVLLENNAEDTAFKLLESRKKGSYLSLKDAGFTTIGEYMDGTFSKCHPMFGAAVRQLYQGFLGMKQREGTVGWDCFTIAPRLPEGLSWIQGSVETGRGKLQVKIRRKGEQIHFIITVPPKTQADFCWREKYIRLKEGVNEFNSEEL